jgi:alpha-tubulin suppressor-like RCC1 family protein
MCWGENDNNGVLGTGSLTSARALSPAFVNTTLTFTALTAGRYHTCGLIADGSAYCWGRNDFGQLGDGSNVSRPSPTAVALGLKFSKISAMGDQTCAITSAGKAYCWGYGGQGGLGNGGRSNFNTPSPVNTTASFAQIAAMSDHACGITTTGSLLCWGSNYKGQLGSSSVQVGQDASSPVTVDGGRTYTAVTGFNTSTCAVATDGKTYCWGFNQNGVLTTAAIPPTAVAGGTTYRTSR